MNKRILFIISDTGGGHRSAANAIIASLASAGAEVSCEVVDLLRASGLPGIRNAPELYAFFHPAIYGFTFLFRLTNRPWIMDVASRLLYEFPAIGSARSLIPSTRISSLSFILWRSVPCAHTVMIPRLFGRLSP